MVSNFSNFSDLANSSARQMNSSMANTLAQNAYLTATNSNSIPRYSHKVLNNDTLQLDDKKEQVKQKAQELAQNIDTKKVKKVALSTALSVATVLAVTLGTNKNINKIWKAGEKVDGIFSKGIFKKAGDALGKLKANNPLNKSKLFKDIKNVTSKINRVQPSNQMAKMSVFGPKGVFSITAPDILQNMAKAVGDEAKFTKYMESLIGKNSKICGQTAQDIAKACISGKGVGGDSFKFSSELMKAIKSNHNLKTSQETLEFFDKLKLGKIGEQTFDFAKNVKMKGWVAGSRGNLGETLKKFAIMNGEAAQTKAGRLVQQMPLIFSESVGNCINDRSLFGIGMCASYLPQTFNQAQEAEKGKKVKTATSELVSSAAGWAVGTASAGTLVYSAASLKNLSSKGVVAGTLKKIGNFMAMGLDKSSSKPAKIFGGALRLVSVLTLSSMFTNPIDKGIKKLFGLPNDAEKVQPEQQKAAMENAQRLDLMAS